MPLSLKIGNKKKRKDVKESRDGCKAGACILTTT
jgi:hypothetical protein